MLLVGHTFEYDAELRGTYGSDLAAYAASDHIEYLE